MKRFIGYAYPNDVQHPSMQSTYLGHFDKPVEVLAFLEQNVKEQHRLRDAMLLTFIDTLQGYHLDVLVRSRGGIESENVRDQLEALTPKPHEGRPMLRYHLYMIEEHEPIHNLNGLVDSWNTVEEIVAALETLRQSNWNGIVNGNHVYLRDASSFAVLDTATSRKQSVYFEKTPTADSQDHLAFQNFATLAVDINTPETT